jgi:hypothetical protein
VRNKAVLSCCEDLADGSLVIRLLVEAAFAKQLHRQNEMVRPSSITGQSI